MEQSINRRDEKKTESKGTSMNLELKEVLHLDIALNSKQPRK